LQYECYFDASHKDGIACIAYLIKQNGEIHHYDSDTVELTSSEKAESHALYRLLLYINTNFESKTSFQIYGDALSVISYLAAKRKRKRREKHRELRMLLGEMKNKYDISIAFIPRRENAQADRLSKGKSLDIINNNLLTKKWDIVVLENKKLHHDEIFIPVYMKYSKPNPTKYQNKSDYFHEHGYLKKNIKVDEDNKLIDGFMSYLILKESDIEVYDVDVCRRVAIEPELDTLACAI